MYEGVQQIISASKSMSNWICFCVFPAEAGTVYGGSLDLTTGVLTVTHYLVQAHKSDFGNEQTGEINYRNIMLQERVPRPSSGVSWNKARETQCLNYGKIANPYSETTYGNYVGVMLYAQSTSTIFRISSPLYDALSDDDEITICYEIAESYTVQLTPQQITSFIGDNTIWSDANGDLTVKYLKKVTSWLHGGGFRLHFLLGML